jgi:cephalosporin hydroxylase
MFIGGRARTIKRFHRLYYMESQRTWSNTHWLGTGVLKCPLDLWMYQEILHDTRPEVVVETGTFNGGSAVYLAAVMDILGVGEVLTIDVDERPRPLHPRVTYRAGSSTDRDTVAWVNEKVADRRAMVILDSDHSQQHVAAELDAYAPIVTPGCYLIVEDTNINGHPVHRGSGPGPAEALKDFLQDNDLFVVDQNRERLMLTFNPGGYLLRNCANPSR